MQWKLDSKTNNDAFDRLVKLIALLLPDGNLAPGSLHLFNKIFNLLDEKKDEWHICKAKDCPDRSVWAPLPKPLWQAVEWEHARVQTRQHLCCEGCHTSRFETKRGVIRPQGHVYHDIGIETCIRNMFLNRTFVENYGKTEGQVYF